MSANQPSTPATVTIRDVAREAGVHVSTVSRALSPEKRSLISDEVLRVVEEAAQRLGYRPNRAASALRTGRTHTIGVLVPDITNAVFPPILQGIEASAAARGYFVFVTNVVDHALARPVLERMLAQRVDGVVMATATRDDPLVDFVTKAGMTAVLVNRADETGRLPAVVSDDRLAMKLAVDHLVGLGHKRIAHLAGPQTIPTGVGRRLGVEQALRDHRMKPFRVVECASYSREAGAAAMKQMLEAGAAPQAVVCCNDLVALGAYDALREAGLRVPQDISVTGHNDMPLVDMVDPPLTTIRLPHRELGWRAAEMLFEEIDGHSMSASTVVLRPELVVRQSTAAPAGTR
ncbi:LacI family DNA-binding transcriptional regulator [Variovorax sp. 375MFSha3.1]|uniref:LacI family DNA-binding transcriptional regulator n=1 Tax=Variovorax guangxiensis TaxID=1775474 RepID=A0A3S0Z7P5_9BURK|nr:LacI family DNA-binding transcriptional regulator [Variovorax guangxiensis]RUR66574.1 LacI family DNA-binding transcriptional regulator [Variovorax guangxiensis]